MPPPKGEPQNRGTDLSLDFARLALWSALLWSAENGNPSELTPERWEEVTKFLSPREIVMIAMHVIRGMSHTEVGAWLGVSRGRTDQHWRSAKAKLSAALEMLA